MIKLPIFLLIVVAGTFGLSTFKNSKIADELTQQLAGISALKHGDISCEGFINADCTVGEISYQDILLADSVVLKGIDPTLQLKEGVFVSIPLEAKIINAKLSLFDITNMLKDDVQKELKNFFNKYTSDYDITVKANLYTDGTRLRDIDIISLDAEDKMIPFVLSGNISQLDTSPILNGFKGAFDFSKKRIVFYDFMKEMRMCCPDKIPAQYVEMSDEEVWDDMRAQTSQFLKLNIKNQFNQSIETDLVKAMISILQDEENTLKLELIAKKETPLEQTMMMFFISGFDAVKEVYDIRVEAK